MKKNSKKLRIKVKFSDKAEEEKEKLLFQVFDLLLSTNKKTKSKNLHFTNYPIQSLTKDKLGRVFSTSFISTSTDLANK